ncbi:hypothetical protein Sjap_005228 [Stephania japonica]|uniref:hAT-like transposase RNase-H fold domain-containing protein n=1 Tax=Stephania japonica TaxID=461633 RepID=A0AAP0K4Q4_9MAGN
MENELEVASDTFHILYATAKAMQPKFNKYWADYNGILSCVGILDPIQKTNILRYVHGKIEGKDEMDEMVDKVVATFQRLFEEYKQPTLGENGVSNSVNFESVVADGQFKYFSEFLGESSISTKHTKSQLDLYLEKPTHNTSEDLNILENFGKKAL